VDTLTQTYLPTHQEKKTYVRRMFDSVASRYDLLNHLLSLGIDWYWRAQALNLIDFKMNPRLLDLATGTGDVAVMALKRGARQVVGIDISQGMLDFGRKKILQKGLDQSIQMVCGDAEDLPLTNESVDAALIAFGIRNVSDISKALYEMSRVLKPAGVAVILEFSRPRIFGFKQLYEFYFMRVLPFIGSMISSDKKAYHYLPNSVMHFPEREDFARLMEEAGLSDVRHFDMTLGIATVYCGIKL